MRHVYSLIRFVPDPARGEFINIGALAGSEESSEWCVREIGNPVRARAFDTSHSLTPALSFIGRIRDYIDQFEKSLDSLFEADTELNEDWLAQLHQDHRNIVQLSYPTPMIAESAEEALDKVFELMIVEPSHRRYRFRKKNEVLAALRRAYRAKELSKDKDICERVVLSTDHYQELFDFAVTNGRTLQLAHSWSFQVPDQELLSRQIKSWGWTVRETRDNGGIVQTRDGQRFNVASDIDVEAVYILPENGQESPALSEACSVFEALEVNQVPLDRVHQVAERAADLLGRTPSAGLGF